MKNLFFCLATCLYLGCLNIAYAEEVTAQTAVSVEKSGDHERAIALFSALAEKGDTRAMIHLGAKYHDGNGVAIDYKQAMHWWLKAFNARNGDAPGNIGVLYRDGKGVKENKKIAYLLFLLTHMEGLGDQNTQVRVNSNLRRLITEMPESELQAALCYTMEYVFAFVQAKGELQPIPADVLPSSGKVRIKDNGWWLDGEKRNMEFTCNTPWGDDA